jgi:hypothetical protein
VHINLLVSLGLMTRLLTISQRRCIHDETGKIDPNKQNAPGKGETRSKRKSAASIDEEINRDAQVDGSEMDLDVARHSTDVEMKHEISNSVEDGEIDPALMAQSRPPRPVGKNKSLGNGHLSSRPSQSSTSPTSATSPHLSTSRSGKSAARRFTPQTVSAESPTKVTSTARRNSMANGFAGASTSPPVSARKHSSTSPTIPQGLSPEEEASWRVAMQLQAEEFGLRNRRS